MKITNNFNVPCALVDAVQSGLFKFTEKCYSVTNIISDTKCNILYRRHYEEIEQDVVDSVNALIGTAVHKLIESFDKTGYAEVYFKQEIRDGYYLTGKTDLYDKENNRIVDWKTASCWKVIKKDYRDYTLQNLMYAWLGLKQYGWFTNKFTDYIILKDWSPEKAKYDDSYPKSPIVEFNMEINSNDLINIEEYIRDYFDRVIEDEKKADNDIKLCDNESCWYEGDKFAVYRNVNNKRADKLCNTEQEAKDYIKDKLKGVGEIVKRNGTYKKCENYCLVKKWCNRYEIQSDNDIK